MPHNEPGLDWGSRMETSLSESSAAQLLITLKEFSCD